MLHCKQLDDLYNELIAERSKRGPLSDESLDLVKAIKDHMRQGHHGQPCTDPEIKTAV
jgi:hypothetical protein